MTKKERLYHRDGPQGPYLPVIENYGKESERDVMMKSLKTKLKYKLRKFIKDRGWVDVETHSRLQYDYRTVVRQRNNYMDQLSRVKYVVNENDEHGGPTIDNWDAFEKDTEELYQWRWSDE